MIRLTVLTFCFICPLVQSQAQCDPVAYANQSVDSLSAEYHFLKSYELYGEAEFSCVLTQGTDYYLVINDSNDSVETLVSLFDKKRNLVLTNELDGEIASRILFKCHATGIYYLHFTFPPDAVPCAGAALGFKR